ncbi:MAG: glycosyltransferase family 1 protein [Chloroflexota bacterium]|nr:MAG: glycosyltransferase family 1 protein [Chloroflexota bacterium]
MDDKVRLPEKDPPKEASVRSECELSSQESETLRREIAGLRSVNAQLLNDVRWLQEEVTARDRLIQGIYAGRVWRMVAPLFHVHHFARRLLGPSQPSEARRGGEAAESLIGVAAATGPRPSVDARADAGEPIPCRFPVQDGRCDPRTGTTRERPEHYDVLCLGVLDWDFVFQRPHQIAVHLAQAGHRVFYVSPGKRCAPHERRGFVARQRRENVYEIALEDYGPVKFWGGEAPDDSLDLICAALDSLRQTYDVVDAVVLVQQPFWRPVSSRLRQTLGWRIVYDCMDDWAGFAEVDPAVRAIERELVRESDLMLVSSQTLLDKWADSKGDQCVLVRNACDFNHFRLAQPNDLLDGMKRPLVGYFGAIAEWFDFELVQLLARERPQYTFVFLGWPAPGIDVSRLRGLPNVHFLGRQVYSLLPYYLYNFDACVIPFLVNELTQAVDPVKLYEYITLGKPVVATRMAELLNYAGYLYIADSHRDFLAKLDAALIESDADLVRRRTDLAQRNTWHARVQLIEEHIERIRSGTADGVSVS